MIVIDRLIHIRSKFLLGMHPSGYMKKIDIRLNPFYKCDNFIQGRRTLDHIICIDPIFDSQTIFDLLTNRSEQFHRKS